MRTRCLMVLLLCLSSTAWGEEAPPEEPGVAVRTVAELGFLEVLYNGYKHGADGTLLRLDQEGEQGSVSLPFKRLSAELVLKVILVYQPLDLRTEAVLRNDHRVDGVDFPAGTPVNLRYGFDFYRVSYLYDLLPGADWELSVGASLQIRNAAYSFTSADGRIRWTGTSQGPVPVPKVRGRLPLGGPWWAGVEADGFYFRTDSGFSGGFFDLNLRGGIRLREQPVDVFLNVRYLGGGAYGLDDRNDPQSRVSNFIDFATLSLGFMLRLPGS